MITPFDKTTLNNIEHAILASDLGITPANDGSVVRIVIPQLTGERRIEIAKKVGKLAEQAKIAIRNIRREGIDALKKQQKDGEITEDDLHKFEKDIQKITDDATKDVDALADKKSKEITKA